MPIFVHQGPSSISGHRTARKACILRACGALLLGGTAFAQSLVNGGAVRGTLATPDEQHTYTFEARGGDRFELRLVDVDDSAFTPELELFNPEGELLRTNASPDVVVVPTTEVVRGRGTTPPGTYTVVVSHADDVRSQSGTYDLHLVLMPGANGDGELLDGLTVFGEIERGDLDSFTFTAEAGQQFEGTITPLFGGTLRLRVEWASPNQGFAVGTGGTFHFSGSTSPGGLHTLVLSDASPSATGTGLYSIVVHGTSAAPPYPPSVFWPGEFGNEPLLLDNAGHSGLGPKIGDAGEPFNVSIDCSRADSPALFVLSISTGFQAALTTPRGWLYLDGPRLLTRFGRHTRSLETWFPEPAGLAVPNDLALVGTSYTVQGGCGGIGGSMRLSGAITQTIGQ
jgi:hypothetical protein